MNTQFTYARQLSHRVHSKARQAFTLVELLVVITIIGILVALLLPAINGVFANARDAQMGIEVANLAQAMEAYKLENLSYPPDFAFTVQAKDKAALDAHLARKYRYRNKVADVVPMAGLDPAEALVFWLGGLSADTKMPIKMREAFQEGTGPAKGGKPYFEFDQARLADRDEDGWLEYYPEHSEMPYVYLSSQNYGVKQNDGSFSATAHAILDGGSGASSVGVRAYAAELEGAVVKRFVGEDKYQILCAGRDSIFGAGMTLSPGNSAVYPDGVGYVDGDEDNLTNFSEGQTLQAATP